MLLAFSIRGQECETSFTQDSLSLGNTLLPKAQTKFPLKNSWCFIRFFPPLTPYKFRRIGFYFFLGKKKTTRCLLSQRTLPRKRIPDNSSFLLDVLTESINLESRENKNTSQRHIFLFQEQTPIRKVSGFFSPKRKVQWVSLTTLRQLWIFSVKKDALFTPRR